MQNIKSIFYIIIYLIILISKTVESNSENRTFVPTKNWQTIEEGQSIPAGLHVRINLQTGKKEAKLLDEDEKSGQALAKLPDNNTTGTDQILENIEKPKISKRLEETLKKIQKQTLSLDYSPEKYEEMKARIKKSFKDYKQLKKDFKDMKMNMKTDAELITGLFKEYNNTLKDSLASKEILSILEDFDYLVHQVDNALWFINSGGLDIIIRPMIVNQTNIEYRISSLRLLGALTQNNPKAQVKVYENNFGSYISNILFSAVDNKEISTGLYAFGSLLRKFPYAQKEILSKLGTKALIEVLKKNTNINNKAKTLILIGDLIQDRENILNKMADTTLELFNQYRDVELDIWLQQNRFCKIVLDFIWQSKNEWTSQPDVADNIIEALSISHNICLPIWSNSPLMKLALNSLEDDFKISSTEYSVEVGEKITKLKEILFVKKLHLNDEL